MYSVFLSKNYNVNTIMSATTIRAVVGRCMENLFDEKLNDPRKGSKFFTGLVFELKKQQKHELSVVLL